MSIDTELIVQILMRSPQGLTPFEILDHLINEPQYQGFTKSSIFSKLLPKLNELRDLQTLVHVSPRWLLIESTEDVCEPDVLVESSSQSDCLDNSEPFQDLEPSIDESTQFNEERTILSEIKLLPKLVEVESISSLVRDNSTQVKNSNDETLSENILFLPFDSPIEILKLSRKSYNCLINRSNIKTVGELQELSDAELMDIRDFGQKSLDEVKIALSKFQLMICYFRFVQSHHYPYVNLLGT